MTADLLEYVKPLENRASKADERRERILAAARNLFMRHGFHGTGVAQIAHDSGVKVGQLYRDFACKEDIVAALVEADVISFLEHRALSDAVAARDFAMVRRWIERFMEDDPELEDDCALIAETISEATRNPRVAEIVRGIDKRVRDSILTALDFLAPGESKAQRRRQLADFIMAVGHGVWLRKISDPQLDYERLATYVGDLIDAELSKIIAADA
ncbi:TetR/AcrR family transcriptional regulator [Sphingomonas sp. PvP056]|jgi:AcrR family transcriptional regulator|uniref:TetR/AcrR family transcriptional regulator n=1 Tax=Sphingomonas sp. PvP056 TaxID=3156392 RepID=UPI0033977B3E